MSDETRPDGSEVREGQRIAKVMARAGLCSRRDAETWIAEGRVSVNGKVLDSPAYNVSEADDVRVDGRPLAAPERTRLFLFHKPRGLVTTARDPEGRPTIFDALPPALPRVVTIGRLDINTEGLLLLTNDGGLARVLELPATGWLRRYRVRAHGAIDQARLDRLRDGVAIDGVDYLGIEARLDREQGSNAWITLGLREGKNREIKRVLEHLGLAVNRLIRISYGPFELGDLGEGELAEVRTRVLRDQLGARIAKEAGANFDAPLIDRSARRPETIPGERRRSEREARETAGRTRAQDVRSGPPGRSEDRRGRYLSRDEAPRRAPPGPSAPERRRKHVSALRAEIASDAAGPRKRVERGATHDRKGREIVVERLTPTGEKARGRAAAETRGRGVRARGQGRSGSADRRGRSFEARREAGEAPKRASAVDARQKRGPRERRFERGDKRSDRAPARPGGNPSPARDIAPREGGRSRPMRERTDQRKPPRSHGPSRLPGRSPNARPPAKGPSGGPGRGPRRPPRKP